MIDKKDLELETAYNEAVKQLEISLESLKVRAAEEADLALKFANDSHIPLDAIKRLATKVACVRAVAHKVADARSALVNYRFNR